MYVQTGTTCSRFMCTKRVFCASVFQFDTLCFRTTFPQVEIVKIEQDNNGLNPTIIVKGIRQRANPLPFGKFYARFSSTLQLLKHDSKRSAVLLVTTDDFSCMCSGLGVQMVKSSARRRSGRQLAGSANQHTAQCPFYRDRRLPRPITECRIHISKVKLRR